MASFKTLAIASAVLFTAVSAAQANCNFGPNNQMAPYGDIGAMWQKLEAAGQALGCPITPEMNSADGPGRIQSFQFGQISWSPGRGDHPLLAARQAGNDIELLWTGVRPFNYDFWIARTDQDGVNIGQADLKVDRTNGYYVLRNARVGSTYSFVVEGCDEVDLEGRKASCKQGWLNRVAVKMSPTPLKRMATFNDPPLRKSFCWTDSKCLNENYQQWAPVAAAILPLL